MPPDTKEQTFPTNITLRDWFAGQTLAARGHMYEVGVKYRSDIAEECYLQADAMLKARAADPK
jgi:hypothetical protein